jgi:hypothetical protein
MPLQLPALDDRRYADLLAEARRLIPIYDPTWTDHNSSDPGITLIELFAWLAEMLIYRLDRITAENQRKFLRLLNGPDWKPGANLDADIRAAVLAVRARDRAVTAADFKRLATEGFNQWLAEMRRFEAQGQPFDEWWDVTQFDRTDPANNPSAITPVARASCVPRRDLDRGTEATRTADAPSHVSVVVLPQQADLPQPPDRLKAALWWYLDDRRILTTRHHVVGPRYVPISGEIVVACTSDAVPATVRGQIVKRLDEFLAPLDRDLRENWPFGRDVFVSELNQQIEGLEGVDYVTDLMLASVLLPSDELSVAGTPLWHPEGDLIGIALAAHHLPLARFDPTAIVVVQNMRFLPVRFATTLGVAAAADAPAVKRGAKAALRELLHPLHHGPGATTNTPVTIALADIEAALQHVDGVVEVTELIIAADPGRLAMNQDGEVTGLKVNAGEIIDWQVDVTVQSA